jgi:ABC-2 type transport system permease protein
MAGAIFFQALRENFRARRFLPWMILSIVAIGISVVWMQSAPDSPPVDQYSAISYLLVLRVVALAAAIYATGSIGAELEQRTIVYLLTRPVPRWLLLTMRFLASAIVVFAIGAVWAVVVTLTLFHGKLGANPQLGPDLLATAIGALAYCALFTLASIMLKRAMIWCLIYVFGWEVFVPLMPGSMYYLSVFSYLQAVAHHLSNSTNTAVSFITATLGTHSMAGATAWSILICLTVGCVLLASWWFTHFEFLPSEEGS